MLKTILITGASSGIGLATAEMFAQNKWNLILLARNEEKLINIQQKLAKKFAIDIYLIIADVADKLEIMSQMAKLPKKWQNIDICFNNAGLALGKEGFEINDIDDVETMVKTNINGLLYVTRAVLPYMIKNNKGYIINMGSTAAKDAYMGGAVYCASKAAIDQFSKGLRIDLLQHKIKVTVIHPGAVNTNFSLIRFKGDQTKAQGVYKGYQPLYAKDIAEIIWYLANTPKHLVINELIVSCMAQANSHDFFKE